MKNSEQKLTFKTCPLCNKKYIGAPALSREDNATLICPECGSRQALKVMGISDDEAEKIINEMKERINKTMC